MSRSHRSGFTKIELVIILVVVALLVAVGVPVIQHQRELARRARCLNNLKQIGLAFQSTDSTRRRFPPSCGVTHDGLGRIVAMDGWSWCVPILPYMEYHPLWKTLNTKGVPLVEPKGVGTPHADALAMVLPELLCPAFNGSPYIDRKTRTEAITNYKAMGGTHLESLNVASLNPTVPRYGEMKDHPDGGCYPGSTHGTNGFNKDGTAHTVIVVETVEQNVARWTVGVETCVVGLPPVVTFEEAGAGEFPYARPTGYTSGNFWDRSTIPDQVNKTYLDWDYEKHPYGDGGVSTPSAAATGPIKYGPSSHHPGVINHAWADGSVSSQANGIDAGAYMFMITRKGGEPMHGPNCCP